MDIARETAYPLPITRSLKAAEKACAEADGPACHDAVLRVTDAIIYYLGAVAVAQYSQALYSEQMQPDPTLNRSLRSLRRILPGQWLGWIARGLDAVPNGPVEGLAEWYAGEQAGALANAYETMRRAMVEHLGYTGEYGPREKVSPRVLLELIDQYRIRRGKVAPDTLPPGFDRQIAATLLSGLRTLLSSADFMPRYQLYAPTRRQLLMGDKPTTPMPPMSTPPDVPASILLYPPGEMPDYTKRPDLQSERVPLFPLDPLLAYLECPECKRPRVAALQEVVNDAPTYLGLDPDCGHLIKPL